MDPRFKQFATAVIVAPLIVSVPLSAAPQARSTPVSTSAKHMLACREIVGGPARLACFDMSSAAMAADLASRSILIVDRQSLGKTRRALFGLSLPKLDLFGDDRDDIKQINGIVAGASHNRDGGYVVALEDGSRWSQIDDRPIVNPPERGDQGGRQEGGPWQLHDECHPPAKHPRRADHLRQELSQRRSIGGARPGRKTLNCPK